MKGKKDAMTKGLRDEETLSALFSFVFTPLSS
jgi:hypothetical protein